MPFTEHIIDSLISTTAIGLITQSGHTRQANPALRLHLVDEPSSIRLVRALLRGRPVEHALVQRVVLLLLLGVGRAVRSRLVLLPPCACSQSSRHAASRTAAAAGGRARRAQPARAAATLHHAHTSGIAKKAPHKDVMQRCCKPRYCKRMVGRLAWVGCPVMLLLLLLLLRMWVHPTEVLPADACTGMACSSTPAQRVLCSPDPCDMPCWRSGRPWRLGSHRRCLSNAKVAQAIACSSVCFLSQHEGSAAGAWQSQDSWPVLTAWLLLGARLASPAAHHVLRLVGRCRHPAMPKRVHHVPHLQQPR